MLRRVLYRFIFLITVIPLTMWLFWFFTPKKQVRLLILDKTVLNTDALEHKSFNWMLNYNRYTKTSGSAYQRGSDYLGFFPLQQHRYLTKDLTRITDTSLDSMADSLDMVYYADTYGVYENEWYRSKEHDDYSKLIYGGLDQKELYLLQAMKKRNKLVLIEYNLMAEPTNGQVREQTEDTFGFTWSGWTGKHFESLDTTYNKSLPTWVVNNYMRQHNGQWPFMRGGIVFNHMDETVVILEDGQDLDRSVPTIYTRPQFCSQYHLPDSVSYPYWFDINAVSAQNEVMATYRISTTPRGDSLLTHYGIPKTFPAVFRHTHEYLFYYLAGDFCDNPVSYSLSYFKGIQYLRSFFYTREPDDRRSFFWNYYYPLVSTVMNDYYNKLKHN